MIKKLNLQNSKCVPPELPPKLLCGRQKQADVKFYS